MYYSFDGQGFSFLKFEKGPWIGQNWMKMTKVWQLWQLSWFYYTNIYDLHKSCGNYEGWEYFVDEILEIADKEFATNFFGPLHLTKLFLSEKRTWLMSSDKIYIILIRWICLSVCLSVCRQNRIKFSKILFRSLFCVVAIK